MPVKSSFLTIISHLGPTHLQRVSASLGESLWQTGSPYLPILNHIPCLPAQIKRFLGICVFTLMGCSSLILIWHVLICTQYSHVLRAHTLVQQPGANGNILSNLGVVLLPAAVTFLAALSVGGGSMLFERLPDIISKSENAKVHA